MNRRIDKKRQKMASQAPAAPIVTPCVPETACSKVSFYIQYQNDEYLESDIVSRVIGQCKADGASDQDLADLSIYLKPEDQKVYYAYNGKNGALDL